MRLAFLPVAGLVNGLGGVLTAFCTPRKNRCSAPGSSLISCCLGFLMTGIPRQTTSTYEAHGAALAAWQMVETSLYYLVHGALKTEEALSSTVFFHIRSPSAKVALAVDLMQQAADPDLLNGPWKAMVKRLRDAADTRNHLAHYETMAIVLKSKTTGEIVVDEQLTEPFHDVRTHQKGSVKTYDKVALESTIREFMSLARDLLHFVQTHFPPGSLPQGLVRKGRERAQTLLDRKKTPPKS